MTQLAKRLALLGLCMVAGSGSSMALSIGMTEQGTNPKGELKKLTELLKDLGEIDRKPEDSDFKGTTGSPYVYVDIDDEAALLDFIAKDDKGYNAASHTYTLAEMTSLLGDISGFDVIYAGVKAGTKISWYEYPADELPLVFASHRDSISHISFYGLDLPGAAVPNTPPNVSVPDNGSMLLMLGGGLVGLAGLSRRRAG